MGHRWQPLLTAIRLFRRSGLLLTTCDRGGANALCRPSTPYPRGTEHRSLRVMNLLEDVGGRLCGTEYMFSHALDPIPEHLPPMQALATMALADPMIGSPRDRAERICADIRRFGAESVVISRIPGASHCAWEGALIGTVIRQRLGIPVVEIEVAPVSDAMESSLRTRLEAIVETVRRSRYQ